MHPAGDLTPICRNYLLADFLADAAGLELVKSVHVQAEIDRADPVAETAWLQAIADDPASGGFPHGIVAFADLADPAVEQTLEAHCRHANMRGIRYLLNHEAGLSVGNAADRDWLADPRWQRGYAMLRKHGLSFDLQIFWPQMAAAAELAQSFPDTPVILNHTGMPRLTTPEYLAGWRAGLKRLAEAPNVSAKISGLAMWQHGWTVATIRPLVQDVIEAFGPERCLFASNFPVDRLHKTYAQIWQAFDQITADFSATERQMMFHDNALRLYRLGS